MRRLDVPAAWRNVLFSTWQELREDAKQDRASSPSKVRPASRRLPWNLPSKSVADKQGTPASIPEVPPVESTNITPEAQTPGVAEKQSVQDLSAVPPQDTPESVPSDAVPLDPGAEPSIEASPLAPSVEFGAPNTMLTETTVPFSVVQTGSDIEEPTPMSENTLSVTSTEDTNLAPDTSAEDPPTLDQSASEEGLIVQPPIGATTVPAFEHVDVPEPSVSDASEEEPSPAPIVDVVEHEVSEELTTPIAEATISPPEAESLTIAEDPVIEADSAPIPEPEFVILPTTTILPSEEVVSLPSAQDNTQTVDSTELLENDVPQVTLSVPPELASEEPEPEKDDLLEEPETQKENADLPYPSDNTHAEPAPSPTVDVDTLDRIKRLEERIVELEALLRGSERTIETMREEVRAVGDHLVQQAQRTIQHTRDLSAVLDNMSGISRSIKAVGLAQLIPLVIYSSFGFYALLRTVRASR
ncbi:hypothetical protein SISNIDRAFT_455790 [Sistotremastrum niveocremeum HHB9708]|uniref:Uncharacterized protein n=2 Tax=Sistotremastraceae TaxID=3402574 RepID=A0A164TQM8_9AGAM|nr:hypothetical protein SISNIDRAFT_455790 [Sistotremastrum niveocremeum HHB9708]KZT42228.1 hypothetical protein SISSUDRAFT_1041865 [Sistotremastrum suecicum HHB10207 ss-3]